MAGNSFSRAKHTFILPMAEFIILNLLYHLDVHSLNNYIVKLYMTEDDAPVTQILNFFLSHTHIFVCLL